jgi:hypothetical protein
MYPAIALAWIYIWWRGRNQRAYGPAAEARPRA